MARRKYRVTVLYRSGNIFQFKCARFQTIKRGAKLTEVTWTKAKPEPYLLGVDDVEAIYVDGPK